MRTDFNQRPGRPKRRGGHSFEAITGKKPSATPRRSGHLKHQPQTPTTLWRTMTTTDPSSRVLQTLDDSVVVGSDESFVPLEAASIEDGTIRVPYDKDMIKGAPNNDAGEPLSETDEQQLYSYYNLTGPAGDAAGYDRSQARRDNSGTDIPDRGT